MFTVTIYILKNKKKHSNFKIRLFFGLFSLLYITICNYITVKGALCNNQ